jgi:hypothetical protein
MPQLTDRFGPIPQQVPLDGSGNGTMTFQVNGSNARVTNLYVKVSTSTKQAVCTMYKGQVADSNLIQSTNSGSTGATASGAIDLTDGETLYVVWTGGDAGATAFATFTGVTIPFDQVGPSTIEWSDPIAAGDGSLVYPALKSPNYVTGSTGWIIRRDGTFELSGGIFRGDVSVTGPNNSSIEIDPSNGQPIIYFNPDTVGPPAAALPVASGVVYVFTSNFTTQEYAMILASPNEINHSPAQVILISGNNLGSEPVVEVSGILRDSQGFTYANGITGTSNVTVTASQNVNLVVPLPFSLAPGVSPIVFTNLTNGPAGWISRALSPTDVNFTINVNSTGGAAATFTAVVQWAAFLPF